MPAASRPLAERHLVHTGGADLHAEITGSGVPLVLVHGWALDHRVFRPQVAALSRHFKVIAFDRRGFGRSGGEPDMRRELDDIDAVIDALAGEPAHLLGMSQGGRVALRYAVSRPERLRSLILQGAAVDGQPAVGQAEERIPIDDYVRLARAGRLEEVRRRWAEHPMMRIDGAKPDIVELLRDMLADYRGADLVHYRPESYRFPMDVLAAAGGLSLPVLLLTGAAETKARRELAARLLATIPHAEEVVLAGSGHLSNLTEPEAYNRALLDFCRRVDTGSDGSEGGATD